MFSNPFARKPNPPFAPWSDAPLYAAQGYQVMPVEGWRAADGHETPADGPWAFTPNNGTADSVLAILGARLPWPNSNVSLPELQATWISFISIDVWHNVKFARACEAIVAAHVGGVGPVRENRDSTALLLPFRLDDTGGDARRFTMSSSHLPVKGDPRYQSSSVSVSAAGAAFLADGGPYSWREGRGLLQVPRAELPTLSVDAARSILREVESLARTQAAA